jgi:hypothetical protein
MLFGGVLANDIARFAFLAILIAQSFCTRVVTCECVSWNVKNNANPHCYNFHSPSPQPRDLTNFKK